MTISRTPHLVLAGILAAAALACGGGDSATANDSTAPEAGQTSAPTSGPVAVSIDDLAFSPATIEVAAGDTVEWANAEDVPHTVTFSDAALEDSGELGEGDTFSATFADAGTFDYVCAIHPDMKGSVTVQ